MSGHAKRSEDNRPRREVDVADEREVTVGGAQEGDERARTVFERKHDPSRVLALSDGVFAIIITLLVLDITLPALAGAHGEVRRP